MSMGNIDESWREYVPADVAEKYEVFDHRHAALILAIAFPTEFAEICEALRLFCFTDDEVRRRGGNESDFPKRFAHVMKGKFGWHERRLHGKFIYEVERPGGSEGEGLQRIEHAQTSHFVDYLKGRIAVDFEWNSKDQTFDRDLFALRTFYDAGVISVGVIVTRSSELEGYFAGLGPALAEDGTPQRHRDGTPKMLREKFGASTTHTGQLVHRVKAQRGGGCPILALGITLHCRVAALPEELVQLERSVSAAPRRRRRTCIRQANGHLGSSCREEE